MKVTIDRFEGDIAVCEKEDHTMIVIKRDKLPNETKEGYVLDINGESITIDSVETARWKKASEKLADDVWK